MIFPFESLVAGSRELGLVVAVAVGFGFGFVLERAGFGRAQKLVAQFYGTDMTVFKVMFGAIVTAMLGSVVLSGIGLMDLRAVSATVTSATWIWPMIVGGLLLGVGFIVSGYCPGTSLVAAASGKLDGLATVIGVIAGTIVHAELMSLKGFATFNESGFLGQVYLYDLLKLPPAVVALFIALMAAGCFLGAEKLERIFGNSSFSSSFTWCLTYSDSTLTPASYSGSSVGAASSRPMMSFSVWCSTAASSIRSLPSCSPSARRAAG